MKEFLNGKTIQCTVVKSEQKQGPKAVFYVLSVEIADQLFPDECGKVVDCNSFRPCIEGKTYPFTFSITERGGLMAERPKTSEDEKADQAKAAADAKAARLAKEAKEKADYEADEKSRGRSDAQPMNADNSNPAASLIPVPTQRDIALAGEYGYTPQQVTLMEMNGIIPKQTPTAQIAFFFETAKARGLSPITKQIYLLPFVAKSNDQWVTNYAIVIGIDGMRSLADKTKQLAGIDEPLYDGLTIAQWFQSGNKFPTYKAVGSGKDTRYHLDSGNEPCVCTVVVKRRQGSDVSEYVGVATWGEYYPGPVGKGGQWRKMPFVMLAKCAKAQALRDAFSSAIGGLYIPEEFDKQQRDVVDVKAEVVDMHEIFANLKNLHTTDEVQAYRKAHPEFEKDAEIIEAISNRYNELKAEA